MTMAKQLALIGVLIALALPNVDAQGGPPVAPVCALAPADQTLVAVVNCAAKYVEEFGRTYSSVVAEEHYRQWIDAGGRGPVAGRSIVLRSDLLIVKNPGGAGWLPFRDVFEVNGDPVRNRDERLKKLFLENPPNAMNEARRIMDEGARYNIGGIRNINVPLLALWFLEPSSGTRVVFKKTGTKKLEAVETWVVEFVETGRPTIIRGDDEHDVETSGTFWLDPAAGTVLKTFLKANYRNIRQETTVTYTCHPKLKMFVPEEMSEVYSTGSVQRGIANYSNFRQFQVVTDATVKTPKGR